MFPCRQAGKVMGHATAVYTLGKRYFDFFFFFLNIKIFTVPSSISKRTMYIKQSVFSITLNIHFFMAVEHALPLKLPYWSVRLQITFKD